MVDLDPIFTCTEVAARKGPNGPIETNKPEWATADQANLFEWKWLAAYSSAITSEVSRRR
jgi:hypothetical protein